MYSPCVLVVFFRNKNLLKLASPFLQAAMANINWPGLLAWSILEILPGEKWPVWCEKIIGWSYPPKRNENTYIYRRIGNWHFFGRWWCSVHFRKWKVGPMCSCSLEGILIRKKQVNTEYGQWKSLGMISMSCCYVVEFQGTKYHDGTAPSQFKQMSEEDRRWGPFHETDVKHIFEHMKHEASSCCFFSPYTYRRCSSFSPYFHAKPGRFLEQAMEEAFGHIEVGISNGKLSQLSFVGNSNQKDP